MTALAIPLAERLRKPFLVVTQVTLLALIWICADFVSRHYIPQIPSSLLGMAGVLLLLGLRVIRRDWLAHGAGWLISEMLLFFVPAVIAIIQYPELVHDNGFAIMVVILGSTVCVMTCTALAVDATWRLQKRFARHDKGDAA